MAKRKIVRIDDSKCTGCGLCIPNCAEAALQIIDGKARLVKDIYCDGLGACLGHCPEGAITIEEREAVAFDEEATKRHLEKVREHQKEGTGCPGIAVRSSEDARRPGQKLGHKRRPSELMQWPIQLMLVPVEAPFFRDADLLVAADCVAFGYGDFHQDFLKGKALVIGCPKLDAITIYEEKLSDILKLNNIKTITVVHMEVPCCFGLKQFVDEALRISGRDVPLREITIGMRGDIIR